MEITADQVRVELEKIISENPGRVGSIKQREYVDDDINDVTCVYFMDENGIPVNTEYCESLNTYEIPKLVTPVCIVGQWVQSFHPELKELMFEVFIKNTTMSYVLAEVEEKTDAQRTDYPLSAEVLEVLKEAQTQQDTGKLWANIDLDGE